MKPTRPAGVRRVLREIERRLPPRRESLIPALQLVQERLGWLPREAMPGLSRHLRVPESEIWGAASFYAQFQFTPSGRNVITVCRGTACHVRGSAGLLRDLERRLGVAAGRTTPDLGFTLQQVACFGSCAMAPVVVINGKVHGSVNAAGMKKLVDQLARSDHRPAGRTAGGGRRARAR